MKVQVSGEGGYIVSVARREFPGSKSHWPNDLVLGVVKKGGAIDVWPAPYGTQTRGDKPPPGWHGIAERLLNSPAARRAILAGLKKYRKEMRSGTWGVLVKLSDGRKNVFSTVGQATVWGESRLRKMPNLSAYGLFHQDPKSVYHSVPFEALVKNEHGVMRRENAKVWDEIMAAGRSAKHESGGNPHTTRQPGRSQEEHFTHAHAKSAGADETMLNLLYGPNPITDDELRKLIAKRPHVYGKYASYLGKRGGAAKHERGGNPRVSGRGGRPPIARARMLGRQYNAEAWRQWNPGTPEPWSFPQSGDFESAEDELGFTKGSLSNPSTSFDREASQAFKEGFKEANDKARGKRHESGGNPHTSGTRFGKTLAESYRQTKKGWESYFERVVEALRPLGLNRSHADEYASLIRSSWATAKPVRIVALTLKAYEQGDEQALQELRRPSGVTRRAHHARESAGDAALKAKMDAVLGKK
jgi:hypothetical protein